MATIATRRRRSDPLLEAFWILLLASGLGSFFAGCGDSQGATGVAGASPVGQAARLEGFVLDQRSGAALPGALVVLEAGLAHLEARAGADGGYRFPAVTPGHYQLRASAITHGEHRSGIFLAAGFGERRDLRLAPLVSQGAVELVVVDSVSMVPLAGVDVVALDLSRRGLTDVNGRVLFGSLTPGAVRFQLRLAGYRDKQVSVTVVAGVVTSPTLGLVRGSGSIEGTVTSTPSMAVLPGVLVSVPGLGIQTVTDAAGRYLLVDVPADSFTDVLFSEASHFPLLATTAVVTSRLTTLDAVLTFGTGQVQGTVRRLLGPPIAGATVSIPFATLTTVTDAVGFYRFDRVPADSGVAIGAFAPNHQPDTALIMVPPDSFVVQDFDLVPISGGVTGTVRRANGLTAVAGALVSLPNLFVSTSTNAFGAYAFANLPAQVHLVSVQSAGLSPLSTAFQILPGQTIFADLFLQDMAPPTPVGILVGTVRNASSMAPVANALLSLPSLSRTTFSRSDGAYAFTNVPATVGLPVSILAAGFTSLSTTTTVVGSLVNLADFDLSPL